ncbi:MAG: NB-ARC domain-containing protein, partial [Planctomycetota bacterium]
ECATGEAAVPSGSLPEMIQRTLDAPIAVRERGLVSSTGAEVLRRLLHPDPAARPATAGEARREIDRWIASDLADAGIEAPSDATRFAASQLPVVFTELFGREVVLSELVEAVERERIVTLVGFGGVGKTRLAVEVAHRFGAETGWVPLASVESRDRLVAIVGEALGLEESARSAFDVVVDSIGDRRLLLVLDNGEQIVDDVGDLVARLVERCPRLSVLVTSRERLGLSSERAIEVEPLPVPSSEQLMEEGGFDVSRWPSVQLFVERASRLGVTLGAEELPVVGELCRRLDGLPLAIELATSRLRALSVRDLADRLERRFELSRSRRAEGPEHHRTLHTAIEWSVDLLSEEERTLLMRLSVFRDGWTLRAAESVVSDETLEEWAILDGLTSLVEKSLVRVVRSEADGLRYRLWESVREWARAKSSESD